MRKFWPEAVATCMTLTLGDAKMPFRMAPPALLISELESATPRMTTMANANHVQANHLLTLPGMQLSNSSLPYFNLTWLW